MKLAMKTMTTTSASWTWLTMNRARAADVSTRWLWRCWRRHRMNVVMGQISRATTATNSAILVQNSEDARIEMGALLEPAERAQQAGGEPQQRGDAPHAVGGEEPAGAGAVVVHEPPGHHRALAVVDQLLPEAGGEALDRATVELALDDGRIDGPAAVVDRDVGEQPGLAGLDVHLDGGHLGAEGPRHRVGV